MNRTLMIRWSLGGAIALSALWFFLPRLLASMPMGDNKKTDAVIWVAGRYIAAYAPLAQKDLRKVNWPRAYLAPGALLADENLSDPLARPRFSAAVPIPEGQPLSRTLLLDAQTGQSIASLLRPGQVAVSIKVDRANGAGGWVRPGDVVAIFSEGAAANPGLRLIIPLITVLAVDDKRLSPEPDKAVDAMREEETVVTVTPSSLVLTVRANPLEASALIKASQRGDIHIVVRSVGDDLPWNTVN